MKNGKVVGAGREITGVVSNGLQFRGFLNESGEITNFFPTLDYNEGVVIIVEDKYRKLISYFYLHMGDGKFLRILRSYANGEGYGDEYARFVFADYYEEWEEDYFGKDRIAYYIDRPLVEKDEEITLDYSTLYRYLREDCDRYLEEYPQDKSEVEEL
ncbi:ribonuclease toxin immunity protein CdiI [Gracilibacillus caseinilyticus]|uniref:Ribonuclease toxin immunity protein CdiI n=1 Tax=Gracilibacillus caseinilyticus TaxID=2932256 RepID=A0ABY4F1H2_9BACI|nr:ribonuclease toxin immunity protein CdiI [Gracilibacillus caseinilyticus]UOQ50383.1 ribonuclease toxin immunity protein CdiI [Gracilibacillus caseinilyticus]